jgi:hypothetical protein
MARARPKSFAVATIVLLQLGAILHSQGQNSISNSLSDASAPSPNDSISPTPSSRAQIVRVQSLPAIEPSLEEITLHILTDN